MDCQARVVAGEERVARCPRVGGGGGGEGEVVVCGAVEVILENGEEPAGDREGNKRGTVVLMTGSEIP